MKEQKPNDTRTRVHRHFGALPSLFSKFIGFIKSLYAEETRACSCGGTMVLRDQSLTEFWVCRSCGKSEIQSYGDGQ